MTSAFSIYIPKSMSSSVIVWLGLMSYVVLVKIATTIFPAIFVHPSQAAAFAWTSLVVYGAAGLLGAWLSRRTGFPDALDERVSGEQRFMFPVLAGLAAGSVLLITDVGTGMSTAIATSLGVASINIPFPGSVLVYSGAAILTDVIYRLLPIPVLLWLISNVMLRGRGQQGGFWVFALMTSAIEPVTQATALQVLPPAILMLVLTEIYAVNLLQAYLFRKYGFLSSIVMRLAVYLVWHVLGEILK